MTSIFILVMSFAMAKSQCNYGANVLVCDRGDTKCYCKADKPLVAFYWNMAKALKERDSFLQHGDESRLFKITLEIDGQVTVGELKVVPISSYEIISDTMSVTR